MNVPQTLQIVSQNGKFAGQTDEIVKLAGIDPDTLTPREALDALYKLKSVISS